MENCITWMMLLEPLNNSSQPNIWTPKSPSWQSDYMSPQQHNLDIIASSSKLSKDSSTFFTFNPGLIIRITTKSSWPALGVRDPYWTDHVNNDKNVVLWRICANPDRRINRRRKKKHPITDLQRSHDDLSLLMMPNALPAFMRSPNRPWRTHALIGVLRQHRWLLLSILFFILYTTFTSQPQCHTPTTPSISDEPPTWNLLKKWEDDLPQHNLDLPFPEGRHGRYVLFKNQVQQLGWNNQLNEVWVFSGSS